MIYLVAAICFAATPVDRPTDTVNDPAYKMMSQLVGGTWVAKLGKMDVKFNFKFLEDGKMIEGVGHLTQNGKTVINMDSKYGWDPVAKQTYYLDCHGHDTVYNGHISVKDNKLLVDFVGLIGDKGHWITYAEFPTKDRYEFSMYEDKGGKLVPTHVDVKFHRLK